MPGRKVERVSWRYAQTVDARTIFAVAHPVLEQNTPVALHSTGSILYNAVSRPQHEIVRYRSNEKGDKLCFARLRQFTAVCVYSGSRLVLHEALAPLLMAVAKVKLADAECVGVLDLDPLDAPEMQRITDEYVHVDFSMADDLIELFGVPTSEMHWREVVPNWPDVIHAQDVRVEFDFIKAIQKSERALRGPEFRLGTAPPQAWSMEQLHEYGLLRSQGFVMNKATADVLIPLLDPPFWHCSFWKVK